MFRIFTYYFSVFISKLFFPCTIRGFENIPREGGAIIASNHRSFLDPVVMGICNKRWLSYMAKDELFHSPVLGWILYRLGAFPVKRKGKTDVSALKEAIRRLKSSSILLVFPEGTRKKKLAVNESESGIGFLAAKTSLPVIPAYVEGTQKALPPDARFFRRHPVTIIFGVPRVYTKEMSYPEITQEIMREIERLAL